MSYDTHDPALLKALHDISGQQRSELALVFEDLTQQITVLRTEILLLRQEVLQMSDTNVSLDQAVNDLDAAVTANLAEGQTLTTDAQQGLNAAATNAAEAAKVEALVGKLNAQTAAEQGITNTAPAPVPVPVPTQSVTVTGQTPSGEPVVDAPVSTGPDAPTTQEIAKQ